METDVFRDSFPVLGYDKTPEFLCTLFVGIEGPVHKFYGLGPAVCEGEHFSFSSVNVKETYPAAPSRKAERAGIWAASARLEIGYAPFKG